MIYVHNNIKYTSIYTWDAKATGWVGNSFGGFSVIIASRSEYTTEFSQYIWVKLSGSPDSGEQEQTTQKQLNLTYTMAGKTVYYTTASYSIYGQRPESSPPEASQEIKNLGAGLVAWIMVYGETTAGFQTIPVEYKGFETSFTISVI